MNHYRLFNDWFFNISYFFYYWIVICKDFLNIIASIYQLLVVINLSEWIDKFVQEIKLFTFLGLRWVL